jgi:hypothetical protein
MDMLFLRRLGLGLAASLFSALLLIFAIALTVFAVLDRPGPVKKALDTSGIYNVFVSRTLAEKQDQGEIETPSTDEAQNALDHAVQQALSPAFIQKTAEDSVDQAYDWLHGRTKHLGLAVNVADAKERFANSIAAYVQQKAATLPVCTHPVQVPATLDELMALNCRPAGVPAEVLATVARQEALKTRFFDELLLTTDNLEDEQGHSLDKKLEAVPRAHRYFIMSLYIIPVVLLLCTVAIIFGSATRRGGMKRVGHMLLWTGLLSIVWALVAMWLLGKAGERVASDNGEVAAIGNNILRAIDSLAVDLRTWWVGIGVAYVLLGVALFVTTRLLNKRTVHDVEALNKSLGYAHVPSAGTTFDPDSPTPAKKQTKNPPK